MKLTWRVYFNRRYIGNGVYQSDMLVAVGPDELHALLDSLCNRNITQWRLSSSAI